MMRAEEIARALKARRCGRGWSARCPAHRDRNPSLSIGEGHDGTLLLHCHAGSSFADVLASLPGSAGWTQPTRKPGRSEKIEQARLQEAADIERRRDYAARIWAEALPAANSLVQTYLNARAIPGPVPDALRFAPALRHPSGASAPAMVAPICDIAGALIGVHRTWLQADGCGKAALAPQKAMFGRAMLGRALGGAVRLVPTGSPLIVTEGIETALSLGMMSPQATLWAALSANGLASLDLPSKCDALVIAPDGDPVGRRSGQALADRAMRQGWSVRLHSAPDGEDWNDVLRRAAAS
ncbi:MAG: toprim domain-containing protein [Neomegalonema sp.]|nr:toprim domain-containing protein [Neomegalonema sp.]